MQINSTQWLGLVRHQIGQTIINIPSHALEQISTFVTELLVWNEKINLTAITDPEKIIEKHIFDSLVPAKLINENKAVLDLGTGGGFPGIPLKIFKPSISVCLVDSSRKKINFLKYVIRLLKLKDISAHQYRAESLSMHPDFSGRFDVVISRAFAALDKFLKLATPLIKPDGLIIAMKGKEVDKEVEALEASNIRSNNYLINDSEMILQVEKYRLPVSGDERSLVTARKYSW